MNSAVFKHRGDKVGRILGQCNIVNPTDFSNTALWNIVIQMAASEIAMRIK
ncbi:MAG: hypothetical protein JETT_2304 [Candidatus Jettenia ecosi]|uniref:Uncharacterized protein n=1 Tax=Candidatus Jettenia ecosi TaxID=2494326 RepID=A0A533Q9T4_9BACT|nr:MAG: hypothetical protein JETT_2304 [Candidatus Jettenia ecosi]